MLIVLSFSLIIIWIIITNKTKNNWVLFSVSLFFIFVLTNIHFISNYFTWRWLDQSVVYHLITWLKWVWMSWYNNLIAFSIVVFASWFFISYFTYIKSKNIFPNKKNIFIIILSYVLLIFSLVVHPTTINVLKLNWYYINELSFEKSDDFNFNNYYKIPDFQRATNKNKNLIFIYLESYEELYLDDSLFPWLSNWLNQLKNESIYFSNIKEYYWANRTIWAMVSSQCGIPIEIPWWLDNPIHWEKSFMTKAVCMWDFLKQAWYNLNYIWWWSLDFAWKGNFYRSHWFSSVIWKEKILQSMNDKDYYYEWWLYDDTVFDYAYKEYEKLASSNQKFGLFLLNMDTHWVKWVRSKKCNDLKYNKNKKSILNAYYCTDYLISNFIRKVRSNENFTNTNIVLMSDHLAMYLNNSSDILYKKKDKRNLLFMILDSENKEFKEINKLWNTFDIWAIVLSNIWFDINQFWIWYNLLSNNIYSIKDKNNKINLYKWKKDYTTFWE